VVQKKQPEILALKGKRQIGALTAAERGCLVTVVVCMSASGIFVPPLIIFPWKNAGHLFTRGAPPGTIFKYQPSVGSTAKYLWSGLNILCLSQNCLHQIHCCLLWMDILATPETFI